MCGDVNRPSSHVTSCCTQYQVVSHKNPAQSDPHDESGKRYFRVQQRSGLIVSTDDTGYVAKNLQKLNAFCLPLARL